MWIDPIYLNPVPRGSGPLCSARQWLRNLAFHQGATKFSIPSWNSLFCCRQLLNLLFSVFWLASYLLSFPHGEEIIELQGVLPLLLHGVRQQGVGKRPSECSLWPGAEQSILDHMLGLKGSRAAMGPGQGLMKLAARALLPWHSWERRFNLHFQNNTGGAKTLGTGWGPLKAW